ncbi:alanine--glyoxylate aminotransferase family protein [Carboxydochorda subterranea]|uniref:Alanine--glyoxylate aminotransferase family protein n=1 Tax=Carboxydichorda subterranea TaxID=3109565 RepID=A0ABZ1BXT4_9FIRM|nr:alanine--glyoxylate aminotransferase family protein [Limnochorda sp. L945t]WRP17496.1 alanine--glyoxylate aminotransferase family protein [Limnochorda sp. L945t]
MEWPFMTAASGPVEVTDEVLRAQSRPVLYHYDPAFVDFFDHTSSLLKQVYRTQYDVVILQGEAVLGLEAAAASLLDPGDKVLNLVSGVFGKWFELYVERHGGQVIELAVPYNEAIDPADVERTLDRHPDVKVLSVVHSETPSGTINPVAEIGRIARERGVLTVVDTVSGLGGEVLSPEEWNIDVAVAGPQKCLGGPPGLSLMAVSPAAWEAMQRRKPPLRSSFLSLLDWKDTWLEQRRFPYTPSVSLIYALESALRHVLEVGVEPYAARHAAIARACREGVKALGLRLWPARESIAGNAVTAVHVPDGITDEQLRGHMRSRYGVMISGGYGELAGKLFRLGHMGKAAHPAYLAAQLAVLERSLADLGFPVKLGAGVGAALEALGDWPPGGCSEGRSRRP